MSALSETRITRGEKFFVWLSWLFLFIAVAGFIPTYWAPLVQGSFDGKPILHIHGMLMLGWTALYVWQVNLVARRQVANHRAWGMAGIAIISLTAFSVVLSAINTIKVADEIGMADQARAFSIVSLSGIALICTLILLAIRNAKRPDIHKRLMTLSFVPLLEAAMARPFRAVFAPPDAIGPPPVFVTIPPSLAIDLVIVALLIYDRRTLGRFHPATVWGGLAIIAVQALCIPLSGTPGWSAIARFIEGLAG